MPLAVMHLAIMIEILYLGLGLNRTLDELSVGRVEYLVGKNGCSIVHVLQEVSCAIVASAPDTSSTSR